MPRPIPQPPTLPLIGNLLDLNDDVPTRALERLSQQYGPIFKFTMPGGRERIVVANVELFEELIDETRFCKIAGPGLSSLGKGPPGLFTAPSEKHPDWQQAHRILVPAFGPLAIRDMIDEMHDIASQLVLKWARKGPDYAIPVTDDFTRLTLDTIALCAMDFRFNSFYQDEMHPFVAAMTNTLSSGASRAKIPGIVQKMMWAKNEQLRKDGKLQKDTAEEMVRLRRENPTEKKDLLNAMINGRDPKTGQPMRDELIASNMITFLIAGHETTSGLLSFAFLNMLKHPATYFKAQQEVDSIIGKEKITVKHLDRLDYINAILRETMRLTPTAPGISRGVRDENREYPPTLGKGQYVIEKGQSILCLLTKIQKDPAVYGETANEFRPERMLNEEFDKLPKAAWKPFGAGMRACIGRAFAWQEALLVMAILLQNFDFRMDDPSYEMQIKSTLTIKPKDFYMRASLRKGISAMALQHSLAGTSSGAYQTSINEATQKMSSLDMSNGKPMTILYGSNTGTCQSFAQKLAGDAQAQGYIATMKDLDSGTNDLPTDRPVAIITASYEGLPPDNAAQFVAWLESLKDGQSLANVKYAVFGCGHKDWSATFHRIPKLVDAKLEQLGGTRIVNMGACDASKGDMFSNFEMWAESSFWPAVRERFGGQDTDTAVKQPKIDMDISTKTRAKQLQHDVQQGKVLAAKLLTAPGEPEKRHLEIKLPEGMEYEAGDYLAILPLNPDEGVRRVLSKYSLPWDATVTIKEGGPVTLPANKPISVYDLLKGFVELSQPATKKNIQTLQAYTSDGPTHDLLTDLLGPSYHSEVVTKRLSVLDLLIAHSSIALPFPQFLTLLPPMRPRHYSISSSPLADQSICTLTYGVINTTSLSGTGNFQGVAGSYMSSLRSGDAVQVSVRSAPAAFHLPAAPTTTPIMMFCNGTGLAPFRAFVQERAKMLEANPHQQLAPAILFVGCRAPDMDRLYAQEFDAWQRLGAVSIRYAFSRAPQSHESQGCKYVQDRMIKDKEDVVSMWENGAKIFLCGSPDMVEGVRTSARTIVEEKMREEGREVGQEEKGKIEDFFKKMRNGRIVVDVFA